MIVPSIPHLIKLVETFAGRDDDTNVTITIPLGDLRVLVEPNRLCEDEGCPHHGTDHVCRSVDEG